MGLFSPEKATPVEPYEALARIYDQVMLHVDYMAWARFSLDFLGEHGLWNTLSEPPRILECACGTGELALLIARYNIQIDAFDRSPAMIEMARKKAAGLDDPPRFFVGSFESFQADPPYDAAICLYDSINYLLEASEVVSFLRRLSQVMQPDGLILFDICTEANSVLHFSDRSDRESGVGYRYVRTMKYDREQRIQENVFEINLKGVASPFFERHQQRIYPIAEIERCIEAAGLVVVEATDAMERKVPTEASLRVHFLVKKK